MEFSRRAGLHPGTNKRSDAINTISEVALLCSVFVMLGIRLIPAHYTSVWTDREFTGWVIPVADRLVDGQKLYADGMHSPMAPLPFVFSRVVLGAEARWIDESFWVFAFQSMGLLTLYFALSRVLPRPIPWLSTLSTIPIYFGLAKTILYDPMAQFWVATIVAGCALMLPRYIAESPMSGPPPKAPAGSRLVVKLSWLGFCTAGLLLTKQNTALGGVLGVSAFLASAPYARRAPDRVKDILAYGLATAVFLALGALAISPYVSLKGLIYDVYLTGSEPKGGSRLVTTNFREYGHQFVDLGKNYLRSFVSFVPILALLGFAWGQTTVKAAQETPVNMSGTKPRSVAAIFVVVASIFTVALFAMVWSNSPAGELAHPYHYFQGMRYGILDISFASALLLTGSYLCGRSRIMLHEKTLLVLFLTAFFPALFHALSRNTFVFFGWSFDNNPMIAVVLALVFSCVYGLFYRIFSEQAVKRTLASISVSMLVVFSCWTAIAGKLDVARECTTAWDDVDYLKGARLRPKIAALHGLVDLVRQGAAPGESVLLLPSDPNIEAWFDRPRPKLTNAIVFVDQYWDRYVDDDFARLVQDPPRLIVLGPENGMWLLSMYGHEDGSGAGRLVKRVKEQLIPEKYTLRAIVETPTGIQDAMTRIEIYDRN